jgi:RNA polymerase sigma-70 factor (ECF subfamily)
MGLRPFVKLSPGGRSSVILMDVIGYSLSEIGEIIEVTVPAVKAALHRGRTRPKALSDSPDADAALTLSEREHERLARYVDRFNARDFDAVRDMLAEDVWLELVGRLVRRGKSSVSHSFTNCGARSNWLLSVGFGEDRPAVLLHRPQDISGAPASFILLEWAGDSITRIRDFHYVPHVAQGVATSAA